MLFWHVTSWYGSSCSDIYHIIYAQSDSMVSLICGILKSQTCCGGGGAGGKRVNGTYQGRVEGDKTDDA